MRRAIKLNPVTYAMNLIQFAFFQGRIQTGMNFTWLTLAACGLLGFVSWQYYRQIYSPKR
jgi:ABC-type polysaccharide/polyol phosphate export permease